MNNTITKELTIVSVNPHYVDRYIKFISSRYDRSINTFTESHHILPKSIFPEYDKCPWNRVDLTLREHYLAHWMLARATNDKRAWFAFNMMRRAGGNSVLFQYAKETLYSLMSELNKGREMTEAQKQAVSDRTKNTVIVKDNSGRRFRVDIDDERYTSGEFVFHKVGTKWDEQTKLKMKESRKGYKTAAHDPTTLKVSFYPDASSIPVGHIIGYPAGLGEQVSKRVSNSVWYNNPTTKKNKRIQVGAPIPDGFVKGRTNFGKQNNKHLNTDNHLVLNLKSKSFEFVSLEKFKRDQFLVKSGTGANPRVYIQGNVLYFTYRSFATKVKEECGYSIPGAKEVFSGDDYILPNGKSIYKMGFSIVQLSDVDISQIEKVVI